MVYAPNKLDAPNKPDSLIKPDAPDAPSAPNKLDAPDAPIKPDAPDALNKPLNKPDARKRQKRTGHRQEHRQDYVVQFKGNSSKKWDGKQITVDGDWLEEVYNKLELCPGRIIDLDYGESDGNWRAMIVSVPAVSKILHYTTIEMFNL